MRRRGRLLAPLAAVAAAALVAGQVAAAVSVVWEQDVTSNLASLSFPYDDAFEPVVATHPTNANTLAVVYEYQPSTSKCGIVPGLRFTTDGGTTWSSAAAKPWAGSGRVPNWHATIAWGPGPTAGSARLYWADTTVSSCSFNDHRLSVAYSDDRGATWSPLFVYTGSSATPAGGFPDITVDRNPKSPNYGTVYATINWFPNSTTEPGMRVIASTDYGHNWQAAEVPALPRTTSNPFRYRIGYRLRSGPDGSVYASFCETDRPSSTGYPGRLAFGISRLRLDKTLGTFSVGAPVLATELAANGYTLGYSSAPGTTDRTRLNSCYTHGIDVDPVSGRVYLAVANYILSPNAGDPRGYVRLGRSDDKGQSWSWQRLATIGADASGRPQSANKPTLVVRGATVFVGFHVLTDDPRSTSGVDYTVTVGNAFVVSSDGGGSWGSPRLMSTSRWNPDWLDMSRQGAGLRDRAELTASGRVFYAYGDGRKARAKPDSRWGRCQIYGDLIDLG